MLRSYVQGDDYVLGKASAPGQASAVNLSTTNTACAGNVATTTIPVDTGVAAGTRGVVALQGKWQLPVPAGMSLEHWSEPLMFVRVPTPVAEWIVGSSGIVPNADQRREIADTGACLKCHVGSLYQHGNTRVDNVTMCVICHNSASSDQNNRVAMGVDKTEAYDGRVGQTYEFKSMLHTLHTAGGQEKPIIIYRTRGIFAWAPEGMTPRTGTPGQRAVPRAEGSSTVRILRCRCRARCTTCITRRIRERPTTVRRATWPASTPWSTRPRAWPPRSTRARRRGTTSSTTCCRVRTRRRARAAIRMRPRLVTPTRTAGPDDVPERSPDDHRRSEVRLTFD